MKRLPQTWTGNRAVYALVLIFALSAITSLSILFALFSLSYEPLFVAIPCFGLMVWLLKKVVGE